jgi:hypothetical protein
VELPSSAGFIACNPGTQSKSITLTNVGSTTLTIYSIRITGPDAGAFSQSNTCGSSVGPGQSCTITVTFSGGSRAHVYRGILDVSDNGGPSPQSVSLSAWCPI